MAHSDSLVAWLADPANHPDQPEHVEVYETHISWVFVTRQFAYKLKKPVRFPFLDFSALPHRHVACEDEVHLNRRLAADVYLSVLPVVRSPNGGFVLGGEGEPIDWLVKMRRLENARRCDALLAKGEVQDEQLSQLADVLAHFYRRAPVRVLKPSHHVTRHEINVLANRTDLLRNIHESAQSVVKRVSADQLQFLRLFADAFHDRVCAGRVIDGHGDLRPEHVYFYSPPKIVDCIEFNPGYRIVDVCDDLSFFAMECAAMGHGNDGQRVMSECLTALGDAPRDELIRFYMSYRACVRAKVALCGPARTRLDQAGATEKALHYLHLAEQNAAMEGPPFLLVVCGGVGTGKSTLGRNLAIDLGFEHVQTDTVRRELFGDAGRGAGVDEGVYRPDNRMQVYREVFQRAVRLLDERVPVVLDGSFQLAGAWQELAQLMPHTQARVLVVHCRCAPELARSRIEKRLAAATSESDARPEMVRDAGATAVEIPDVLPSVSVDTANPPSVLAECVFRRMRTMLSLVCLAVTTTVAGGLAAAEARVLTVAGTGEEGYRDDGGQAAQTAIGGPFGVVVGPDGGLYVCEITNHVLRRVDLASGAVATVAGSGERGYSGDGGPARQAKLNEPYEVRFDSHGSMYFVEMQNHVVRRVDAESGIISTVAGTGEAGFGGDGGPAVSARLRQPHSICLDDSGNLYVCDIGNHRIRRVNLDSGLIETFSGTGERVGAPDGAPIANTPLNGPRTLDFKDDQLYLALREGNAVYRLDLSHGTLHHLAGTGRQGYSGDGGPARRADLAGPKGIAIGPGGDIYLADTESHTIRVIRRDTGVIETLVGDGRLGDGPDGDPRRCRLNRPHGIFVDGSGHVYIGDSGNNKVRKYVPPTADH